MESQETSSPSTPPDAITMTFSEATALRARQGLAGLWLAIIVSLFHDPITPAWTGTDSSIRPLAEEAARCVQVQNHCLRSSMYPLGAPLFWAVLLPLLIAVIFLFGHEFWRRVCPLSFFSQLGRSFGLGSRIRPDSFVARHHFEIQFGLFYLALCCRILFVNADRLCLAVFLLAFILAAFVVGVLYEGKSWCQYFCPVAPVEEFYTGPRGLLGSQAHGAHHSRRTVSQSMCRTLPRNGEAERSACVGCKLHCIDIDAEKTYWQGLMQPRRQRLSYGYAGLVISYFGYYYLYSGNWWYYLSGIWSRERGQLDQLMSPGLFAAGHALPLPKLVAVPLVLGVGGLGGVLVGRALEAAMARWLARRGSDLGREMLRHRCFTVTTVAIFNLFFVFAGYNVRAMLPAPISVAFPVVLCGLSGMWFYRTWKRTPEAYRQEARDHKGRPAAAGVDPLQRSPGSLAIT